MLIHIEIAYLYLLFLAALPSVFGNNKKSKDSRWRPRKQQLATWHHSVRPERENTSLSARSHLSKIPGGPITNCQTAHLSLPVARPPPLVVTRPRPSPSSSRRNGSLPRSSILSWRSWRRPPLLTRSPTTPGLPRPRDNHHHLVDRREAAEQPGGDGRGYHQAGDRRRRVRPRGRSAPVRLPPRSPGECCRPTRSVYCIAPIDLRGSGMGSGWSVDRCCERKTPPMFGVPLRWGWPESWNLAMILSLTLENVVASELLIYFYEYIWCTWHLDTYNVHTKSDTSTLDPTIVGG
jgi:hypothetical protein